MMALLDSWNLFKAGSLYQRYAKADPGEAAQIEKYVAALCTPVAGPLRSVVGAGGHLYTITPARLVAVDSVPDKTTANVVQLFFDGTKVWQQNASGGWWSKVLPADPWAAGVPVLPVPIEPVAPTLVTRTGRGLVGMLSHHHPLDSHG